MHQFRRLLVCLALLGSGCASHVGAEQVAPVASPDPAVAPERFSGFYEAGWEKQVFRPCGLQEEWWSWSTDQIIEEDQRGWGQVFVVLEGQVSPPGSFGHLGQYPRQIVITQVIQVRAAAGAACPQAVQVQQSQPRTGLTSG